MRTNKITIAANNNFKINKTKLKKSNNNLNISFKATDVSVRPRQIRKVVQSFWNRLFPKLQSGLVKTVYENWAPTTNGKFIADEVKCYYRKRNDKLMLKVFQNCTINKNKKIEKASKIFYQYEPDENGGFIQKMIINPEFDEKGELKKAELVKEEYYENESNRKPLAAHYNATFKNDLIVSTELSEMFYPNDISVKYANVSMNENGEIDYFLIKEHTGFCIQNNKSIKEKVV